jgi:hypothetical protein
LICWHGAPLNEKIESHEVLEDESHFDSARQGVSKNRDQTNLPQVIENAQGDSDNRRFPDEIVHSFNG